jgi:DNA-binding NarL/FixJ family response regulator
MFDDMLTRMRDSGVFENDNPQGPGRPAAPLSLKQMAVLRLLTIGCRVGVVAGMCGIGRTTIQEFFPV